MKLLIKILLFVFLALVTNVEVVSATFTFPNFQKTTTSISFHKEISKTIFKVIENDLVNCCQNGNDLVNYRDWGKGVEANAAKANTKLPTQIHHFATNNHSLKGNGRHSQAVWLGLKRCME